MPKQEAGTGSASQRKPMRSEITTAPSKRFPPIGAPPGGPGSSAATSSHPTGLAEPAATDKAILAMLPPLVASALRPMWKTWIDPVYGFDSEIDGYRVEAEVPASDLMQARQIVARHLRGADEDLIAQELVRLRITTKARAENDDDLALAYQAFAEACAECPPDVVVWALRGWARMETFHPSLAEIRDRLQRGVRKRRALMAALRRRQHAEAAE